MEETKEIKICHKSCFLKPQFKLIVNDTIFYIHRELLMCDSEYFSTALEKLPFNGELELPFTEKQNDAFHQFLLYSHANNMKYDNNNVESFLYIAHYVGCPRFFQIVENYIVDNIDNFKFDILCSFIHQYKLTKVKNAFFVRSNIQKKAQDIIESKILLIDDYRDICKSLLSQSSQSSQLQFKVGTIIKEKFGDRWEVGRITEIEDGDITIKYQTARDDNEYSVEQFNDYLKSGEIEIITY
jgi:hypothetical protein